MIGVRPWCELIGSKQKDRKGNVYVVWLRTSTSPGTFTPPLRENRGVRSKKDNRADGYYADSPLAGSPSGVPEIDLAVGSRFDARA